MDGAASATPRCPSSGKVTFDTPGTYTYYCLIHPFMHGHGHRQVRRRATSWPH